MLSYRREEIFDLVQSVNKRDSESDSQMSTKRDRLQNELNSIEEHLFELEKKYGEAKRVSKAEPRASEDSSEGDDSDMAEAAD